jgi:hypothetical protein
MANVHPWFADVSIDRAAAWTAQFFQDTNIAAAAKLSNKPQMFIAETGTSILKLHRLLTPIFTSSSRVQAGLRYETLLLLLTLDPDPTLFQSQQSSNSSLASNGASAASVENLQVDFILSLRLARDSHERR